MVPIRIKRALGFGMGSKWYTWQNKILLTLQQLPQLLELMMYPLVFFNIAVEKRPIYSWFAYYRWWFSIVMLVYRVNLFNLVFQNHHNLRVSGDKALERSPALGLRTSFAASSGWEPLGSSITIGAWNACSEFHGWWVGRVGAPKRRIPLPKWWV